MIIDTDNISSIGELTQINDELSKKYYELLQKEFEERKEKDEKLNAPIIEPYKKYLNQFMKFEDKNDIYYINEIKVVRQNGKKDDYFIKFIYKKLSFFDTNLCDEDGDSLANAGFIIQSDNYEIHQKNVHQLIPVSLDDIGKSMAQQIQDYFDR